ncbi:ribosylpyrimidine nucleosidase [Granulimonas faecalis]|uniref:Ribosylpyrimidine nucleosidase n=1 Tax=Granulimonas faecalis TaxID=2894155 RepID=A0AAV5B055_9ACTN|nr:nucleoside hydrolase [Granulimonas faecalis]GJM54964.1 ribosylpyrimidine nucleosidase [Granulimonas faecalis]
MKKLVLDLDVGIDDTLAVAYALASPEVELVGITTTYGNVTTEQSTANALAVCALLGAPDVPVYPGLPCASFAEDFTVQPVSAFIHGKNGVGEVDVPASDRAPQGQGAVDFIVEAVHRWGKDLIYVPTGPLTNFDAAIAQDPSIVDEVGAVVLMGGALTVPGNVTPWSEANISQDPDAADRVFRSGIPATMIGLDVTLQTLLTYRETALWRETGTEAGKRLADITDYYIKAYETTAPHLHGCGLHDPLACAVAVDPSLVECLPINMMVDVEGPTRGRTIGNPELLNDPNKTMEVAVRVDVARFLDEFMGRITRLVSSCQ